MTSPISRHLSIRGRVQGVGYRQYLGYKAAQLGVSGWVRNRRDGSLEAVVHGAPDAVAALITCAHRGPRAAVVSSVTVSYSTETPAGFATRATE